MTKFKHLGQTTCLKDTVKKISMPGSGQHGAVLEKTKTARYIIHKISNGPVCLTIIYGCQTSYTYGCQTRYLWLSDKVPMAVRQGTYGCQTRYLWLLDKVPMAVRQGTYGCQTRYLWLPDKVPMAARQGTYGCQTRYL